MSDSARSEPRPDDGPDERTPAPAAPAPNAVSTPDEVTIRRAPKFGVFILGGAVLGFLATLVVVSVTMDIDRGDQQDASFGTLVGYFSLWGVTIGAAIGAIVAVVLDRVLAKRAARLTAERVEVEPVPDTVDGEIEHPDGDRP
ncbi:hypothetical protein HUN58_08860 [Curtobacterium sp. Csp1]|uniref:hypothetical protein n=1 Tax=unclassified Curtobacterium TaxID=257496 RepID=UPI0015985F57|nr:MULTISPECIES: hypothetical protein [unclassified Curtobacterium]QKS12439.1 hypothetical protein HUN60_04250 [Curtobacterium sp. csp3]QKS20023.1 hypothetical protein HUN58_08860 [Curtobacterium sp. Csp1]